ncbi:hypothetical protein MMC25_003153 [Agyrium rufum]|nr:hypothetical protein [Agyrium rufum]
MEILPNHRRTITPGEGISTKRSYGHDLRHSAESSSALRQTTSITQFHQARSSAVETLPDNSDAATDGRLSDNISHMRETKKRRINQRVKTRPKLLWSKDETNALIRGVEICGFGKWKNILAHPGLTFSAERTAVDLKDRYRTCLANGWASNMSKPSPASKQARTSSSRSGLHFLTPLTSDSTTFGNDQLQDKKASVYPCQNSNYNLRRAAPQASEALLSKSGPNQTHDPYTAARRTAQAVAKPNKTRKPKNLWTPEEDHRLFGGYKKYGFQWSVMAKDESIGLSHRHYNALKDRFRLKFPEIYMGSSLSLKKELINGSGKVHWSLRKLRSHYKGMDASQVPHVELDLNDTEAEEEPEATFSDGEEGDDDDDDDDEASEEEGSDVEQAEDYEIGNSFLDDPVLGVFPDDENYDENEDGDYCEDFEDFQLLNDIQHMPYDHSLGSIWPGDNEMHGSDNGTQEAIIGGDIFECDPSFDNLDEASPAKPQLWEELATKPIFDFE